MAAADRLVVMQKGAVRQVGTAREIYETPSDLFVAGFIGHANLLRGKVTAVRGTEADIMLSSGSSVTARHDGRAKVGENTSLALRPEDFRLAVEEAPDMNNIRGTMVRVNYLGASINAGVRVGETNLVVSVPRGERVAAEGEQVFVRWPKSAGIMLSEAI
jgi:putative spermidine/putrescine transport system ATP-binding protein